MKPFQNFLFALVGLFTFFFGVDYLMKKYFERRRWFDQRANIPMP